MIIIIAPEITIIVTANFDTPLMVGQTGNTLTCGVSGDEKLNLTITFQWARYNGSTSIHVGTELMNSLPLSPLRLSDAGHYSCSVTGISTLLNNPVTAENNQSVIIQSKHVLFFIVVFFCSRSSNLILKSVLTVPDPQSVTITSSDIVIGNGSDVTLTCSVQMNNQNILASELSLLMVNASLIKPDGTILDLSNPAMSNTTLNFTTQVNSFSDTDVGNYTCNITVRPQPSSPFLIGMSQLVSNTIEIIITGK